MLTYFNVNLWSVKHNRDNNKNKIITLKMKVK